MMQKHWIKLDNAAKIFPATVKGSNSQVFRLSCELTARVDPKLLQQALDETVAAFPMYQYVMRRGLFWYYLESTELAPVVQEERKPPCSPLYSKTKKNLLYEVSYFKNRVNLEVFHALSDGTGAMLYLSVLIGKYLSHKQGIDEPALAHDASHTQMNEDSFLKYHNDKNHSKTVRRPDSYKIIGFSMAMLSLAVIAKARRMPPEDYLVYLISDILFAVVPIVLFFTGIITTVIPSILCRACSVATFVALIVFEGKNLWLEINKRFHV